MEKVRPWCGRPSDRGRLKNRTEDLLTLPHTDADEGVCDGRVSVPLSVHQFVCPIDRQQQQRRPAGLLLSAGVFSRYRSIAVTPAARDQQQMRVASC